MATDNVETCFHDLDQFMVGDPDFEIVRVVIWPLYMLEAPTAESIIRLHEGFDVPLFFISDADPSLGFGKWRNPTVEYCLKCDGDRLTQGFYGFAREEGVYDVNERAKPNFKVFKKEKPNESPYTTFEEEFRALLANPRLLLASDARMLRKQGRSKEAYYESARS